MIEIRIIKETKDKEQILPLLKKNFTHLEKFINAELNEHVFCVGAFLENQLVGHIFIHEGYQYLGNKKFYTLEYVVVDENYRNLGIAHQLLAYIEFLAKENSIQYLTLTSRNDRIEARNLYKNSGFDLKETGIFTKILER